MGGTDQRTRKVSRNGGLLSPVVPGVAAGGLMRQADKNKKARDPTGQKEENENANQL